MINGVFLVGVNALNIARGLLVVAFVSAADYGVWGILSVTVGILIALRQAGIVDRFVQQREHDQEAEFQRALTLDLLLSAALLASALVLVPAVSLAYGRPELIPAGLVFAGVLPALALQAPLSIFYREMDFARQRRLQAVDPLVGFVTTLGLAIAGAGYWSLIIGTLAGAWSAAAVAVHACPYPLRLRFERATLRSYATFSWPLVAASTAGVVMGQAILLVGNATLGLAAAGFITISYTISMYANRLDQVITTTMYPAICAARDRTEVLAETFVKSNRLVLLWALPFGAALTLFAADLPRYVIGAEWQPAVRLLQAVGIMAAVHQIGFNWDAFYRARGATRPIATASAVAVVAFFAICVPLLAFDGLQGLAIGFIAFEGVNLICRGVYITRLFPGRRFERYIVRAALSVVPAVATVLLVRAVTPASAGREILAALLFVLVAGLVAVVVERTLLTEMRGYVRGTPSSPRPDRHLSTRFLPWTRPAE